MLLIILLIFSSVEIMLLIFLKIINQIFHKFINFNSENNNLNNNNAHKFLMMKKNKNNDRNF